MESNKGFFPWLDLGERYNDEVEAGKKGHRRPALVFIHVEFPIGSMYGTFACIWLHLYLKVKIDGTDTKR